jgi:hypothetical protein
MDSNFRFSPHTAETSVDSNLNANKNNQWYGNIRELARKSYSALPLVLLIIMTVGRPRSRPCTNNTSIKKPTPISTALRYKHHREQKRRHTNAYTSAYHSIKKPTPTSTSLRKFGSLHIVENTLKSCLQRIYLHIANIIPKPPHRILPYKAVCIYHIPLYIHCIYIYR